MIQNLRKTAKMFSKSGYNGMVKTYMVNKDVGFLTVGPMLGCPLEVRING